MRFATHFTDDGDIFGHIQFSDGLDFETVELDDGTNVSFWQDDGGTFHFVVWSGPNIPDIVSKAEQEFS